MQILTNFKQNMSSSHIGDASLYGRIQSIHQLSSEAPVCQTCTGVECAIVVATFPGLTAQKSVPNLAKYGGSPLDP